jgi:hypothetical protein
VISDRLRRLLGVPSRKAQFDQLKYLQEQYDAAAKGKCRDGYNRYVKLASFCFAAVILTGCAKNIDTSEAVKAGVIKDIAKKVDIQSMDVSVDSVQFREKEAEAKVSFRPKGGDPAQSIVMNYSLERQGDEWHIKSRNMQGTHVQPPAQPDGATALPPGHPGPSTGGPLPPGHPAVDPTKKP